MRNRPKARSVVTRPRMRRESPGEGAWDLEDSGQSGRAGQQQEGSRPLSGQGAVRGPPGERCWGLGRACQPQVQEGGGAGGSLAWGECFMGYDRGSHGEMPRFWEAQRPSSGRALEQHLRGIESTPSAEGPSRGAVWGVRQEQGPEQAEGATAKPLRFLEPWVLLGPAGSWGSQPP